MHSFSVDIGMRVLKPSEVYSLEHANFILAPIKYTYGYIKVNKRKYHKVQHTTC